MGRLHFHKVDVALDGFGQHAQIHQLPRLRVDSLPGIRSLPVCSLEYSLASHCPMRGRCRGAVPPRKGQETGKATIPDTRGLHRLDGR